MELKDLKIIPLSKEGTEILMTCLLAKGGDKSIKDITEEEEKGMGFLARIIKKRVEVQKLDIEFTLLSLVAMQAFCDNPGKIVFMLMDLLMKMEGSKDRKVTVDRLANFYPDGFYESESLFKYIDEEVKTRNHKYSFIYN